MILLDLFACTTDSPIELADNVQVDNTETDVETEVEAGETLYALDTSASPVLGFTGWGFGGSESSGVWDAYDVEATVIGEDLSSLAITVLIDATSVVTSNNQLTKHLKTEDFFDTPNFPEASFVSTAAEDSGDGTWRVTGDMTLRGTKKSVSFDADIALTDGTLTASGTQMFSRWDFSLYSPDETEPGGDGASDDVLFQFAVALEAQPE